MKRIAFTVIAATLGLLAGTRPLAAQPAPKKVVLPPMSQFSKTPALIEALQQDVDMKFFQLPGMKLKEVFITFSTTWRPRTLSCRS